MIPKPRDPLLAAARIILILMMAGLGLAAVVCALLIPTAPLYRSHLLAELASQGLPAELFWAVLAVLALIAVCGALGFVFFRNLYRIVGTVAEGDPFIPANAQRLSAMGWIVVGAHIIAIPLIAIVTWISRLSEKVHADLHVNGSIDMGGVLLALILFILARVFREGARMRDELEGTV